MCRKLVVCVFIIFVGLSIFFTIDKFHFPKIYDRAGVETENSLQQFSQKPLLEKALMISIGMPIFITKDVIPEIIYASFQQLVKCWNALAEKLKRAIELVTNRIFKTLKYFGKLVTKLINKFYDLYVYSIKCYLVVYHKLKFLLQVINDVTQKFVKIILNVVGTIVDYVTCVILCVYDFVANTFTHYANIIMNFAYDFFEMFNVLISKMIDNFIKISAIYIQETKTYILYTCCIAYNYIKNFVAQLF